ncbi:MAG: hypothetical protein LBG44_00550 [Gemmatimonadota bacterium]|jgi:hypothetical protein|nr:hypothetical protein [Gemmatimonadota bacterium]
MPIRYQNLGSTKRISEIVFAGSHDASITSGSSNAQTQDLDILGQAEAGVRLFDLRILAKGSDKSGASLVGYHGSGGGKNTFQGTSLHTGGAYNVKANQSMKLGTFGLKLSGMLQQAKRFVEETGEFLIFKFDKSTNYKLIADYCTSILGNAIYKPTGIEFGKLQLDNLAQKVVCVFNDAAMRDELRNIPAASGIIGFRNLRGDGNTVKVYDPEYPGLQYFGKGGTSVANIFSTKAGKRKENEAKQKKMLMAMAQVEDDFAANALGMMYWTSTGLLESIRERNKVMWSTTGVRRMQELWTGGLEEAVRIQCGRDRIRTLTHNNVTRVKAYFPNIVMIDFADPGKCQTIYDLNTVVDQKLAEAYNQYMGITA